MQNSNFVKYNYIYSYDFQQPLFQFSVSHDPSEIILICRFRAQETFLIVNVEKSHDAYIF